jgi:hypothetical protein
VNFGTRSVWRAPQPDLPVPIRWVRANGHAGDGPRVAVTGGDAGLEHALLRFRLAW